MEYLLLPLAYLFGSISTAVLIARLKRIEDPRNVGSGNPGATNILRYGGKTAAVVTLLGDVLKGVIPVLIARAITNDPIVLVLVGLMAFLGHLYPIFFGFKGGKGVATALGVWLALSPYVALALVATWLIVAAASRYSSLSAVIGAVLAPAYVWWLVGSWPYLAVMAVMSILLIYRHRSNIQNLLSGKESKIGRAASG
ncbi:MAG: glycerol-3-phosphate 1-O-acyltransferase PlsY [Acidiferrobacterales bacterium]